MNTLLYIAYLGSDIKVSIINILKRIFKRDKLGHEEKVEDIMKALGYDYDISQDIFYSRSDAWQKEYGYCRLYDEAAPSFDIIIDAEPIYFEYNNEHWLIEFWKGQYGICTGAEVGIYKSKCKGNKFEELFDSKFYDAIDENSDIKINISLFKNGKKLFERSGSFWWITGFILGEYSEPEELTLNIEITLKDKEMADAFLNGLKVAGYSEEEVKVNENTLTIFYEKPHTKQAYIRSSHMENVKQMKNKVLCHKLKLLIDPNLNSFDNLVMLKKNQYDEFTKIESWLKASRLIDIYEIIKNYIK